MSGAQVPQRVARRGAVPSAENRVPPGPLCPSLSAADGLFPHQVPGPGVCGAQPADQPPCLLDIPTTSVHRGCRACCFINSQDWAGVAQRLQPPARWLPEPGMELWSESCLAGCTSKQRQRTSRVGRKPCSKHGAEAPSVCVYLCVHMHMYVCTWMCL